LGSLLSSTPIQTEVTAEEAMSVSGPMGPLPEKSTFEIPIDQITPNPHQPRREFSEVKLAELAESIRTHGLIQPIVVKRVGEGYQLIAGERRLRAARLAGCSTIPAVLKDVGDASQAEIALIENIQREDLNPIERAAAYRQLMVQSGLTQDDIAKRLGEDRSSIANHLRLLSLHKSIQAMIADGKLTMGHAKVLAGVTDELAQLKFAGAAVTQELSVRALEKAVTESIPVPPAKHPLAPSAHLQQLEKTISAELGMRVQIRSAGGKGKGRIIIQYASLDQFDDLMQRLNIKLDEI
jgi:ParB family chromosome partitioning protein